jgi:hypothetical protein
MAIVHSQPASMTLKEGQARCQMACRVNPMTPHQARTAELASLPFFPHPTMSGTPAAQTKNSDIHRD